MSGISGTLSCPGNVAAGADEKLPTLWSAKSCAGGLLEPLLQPLFRPKNLLAMPRVRMRQEREGSYRCGGLAEPRSHCPTVEWKRRTQAGPVPSQPAAVRPVVPNYEPNADVVWTPSAFAGDPVRQASLAVHTG